MHKLETATQNWNRQKHRLTISTAENASLTSGMNHRLTSGSNSSKKIAPICLLTAGSNSTKKFKQCMSLNTHCIRSKDS